MPSDSLPPLHPPPSQTARGPGWAKHRGDTCTQSPPCWQACSAAERKGERECVHAHVHVQESVYMRTVGRTWCCSTAAPPACCPLSLSPSLALALSRSRALSRIVPTPSTYTLHPNRTLHTHASHATPFPHEYLNSRGGPGGDVGGGLGHRGVRRPDLSLRMHGPSLSLPAQRARVQIVQCRCLASLGFCRGLAGGREEGEADRQIE